MPTLEFQKDYPDYVCGDDAALDFNFEDYAETLLQCRCGCPYTKAEAQRVLDKRAKEAKKTQEPKVQEDMVFPREICGIMVPFFPKTDEDLAKLSTLIGDQCQGNQFKLIMSQLAFLALTNGISEFPSAFFDTCDDFLLPNPLLAPNVQSATRQPSPPPEQLKVRQKKSIFFSNFITFNLFDHLHIVRRKDVLGAPI